MAKKSIFISETFTVHSKIKVLGSLWSDSLFAESLLSEPSHGLESKLYLDSSKRALTYS